MYIVKVLKRKDAASVVVAVVLALVLLSAVQAVTYDLAVYLSGLDNVKGTEWRTSVITPLISAFLQVIVLEAFLRAVIYVRPLFVRKKSK